MKFNNLPFYIIFISLNCAQVVPVHQLTSLICTNKLTLYSTENHSVCKFFLKIITYVSQQWTVFENLVVLFYIHTLDPCSDAYNNCVNVSKPLSAPQMDLAFKTAVVSDTSSLSESGHFYITSWVNIYVHFSSMSMVGNCESWHPVFNEMLSAVKTVKDLINFLDDFPSWWPLFACLVILDTCFMILAYLSMASCKIEQLSSIT